MSDLLPEYLKEITSDLLNDHENNWDYIRFGEEPPRNNSIKQKFKNLIISRLNKRGFYNIVPLIRYSETLKNYQYLYDNLEFEEDKKLLLKIIAYRTLGYKKVKLPLNTPEYWEKIKFLETLGDKSDKAISKSVAPLYKFDLDVLGYPIKLYYNVPGVFLTFVLKQYEYNRNGKTIKVEKDDVIIDGGSWTGDTALQFALEAGEKSKVFAFEFIPNNVMILEKSLALNSELNKRIEIIQQPLWIDSSAKMYFKDNGSGSYISMEPMEDPDGVINTISIDDFVKQKNLDHVDYIKLNIGGVEPLVLEGAKETIKKFKPKLAVTVFHKAENFDAIPRVIHSIMPEYKFYFTHGRIQAEESLLLADVN